MRRLIFFVPLLFSPCWAATVDRVALVVGKTVLTQSEVDDEARLSALESGKPLDLSGPQRKDAAERLVDQQLLRDEIQVIGFEMPTTDSDAMLRQFRQSHFASVPLYRAALLRYGVTEDELKSHLLWELTAIRFTEQRFRPLEAPSADSDKANRADAAPPAGNSVDQQMEAWLKQQRAATRIVFKQEAFQ
jgi:hypothetical protein